MSIRLVFPATFSLVLLAAVACGPDSAPEEASTDAPKSASGELRRPLNMEDAVAVGFNKQNQTLYSQIAAEDGWQGTFEGILVQIYIFPEIVPGYVPTSFFTDAVKKEPTWQAHRIVRNVGILCGTEGACAKLEKELRLAGGGSAQPAATVAQRPDPDAERAAENPTRQPETARSQPEEQPQQPDASRPEAEGTSPDEIGSPEEVGTSPQPAVAARETEPEPAPESPEGTALPYSVAIASFSSLDDAISKQQELAGENMTLYVAPVIVRGRPYYRLLAGALADRDAAEALQQTLVRKGIKREATAWDIRPASQAFHMGTYANATQARSAIQRLEAQGIPAYSVPGTDRVYVYAGGYEDEADAATLGERLREAGLDAGLVERRGAE